MAEILLIDAVYDGNLDEVRILLRDGININEADEFGNTASIVAGLHGHFEIVSLLIESGARINHQDNVGYTALLCASGSNHISIVSFLIEKGADLNIKNNIGDTPLIIAAFYGYSSIVSLLLHNGADASLRNKDGKTALDLARERNKLDCVGILGNYEHFHLYRVTWLSFSTSFQDNQNQESKQLQSHLQSPSLMRVMDTSDLVRYLTEFM